MERSPRFPPTLSLLPQCRPMLKKISMTGKRTLISKGERGNETSREQFKFYARIWILQIPNHHFQIYCHVTQLLLIRTFFSSGTFPNPLHHYASLITHSTITISVSGCVVFHDRFDHVLHFIFLLANSLWVSSFSQVSCALHIVTLDTHLAQDLIRRSKVSSHGKTPHSYPIPSV